MITSRRTLLQGSGLASLLSAWPLRKLFAASNRPASIYQSLGIRPVINFRGTTTTIGASKVWPEIHEAMAEAVARLCFAGRTARQDRRAAGQADRHRGRNGHHRRRGRHLPGHLRVPDGGGRSKVRQLPNLDGMKTEVIIQKIHRNGYDHAVRNTGVKIIEVENREQLANACGPQTAMMYYLGGTSGDWAYETPISLEECLAVAHKTGFPVLVDAANMLPPWENLRKLAALGTDLICISGGKHMRGPQCSGILAGKKDLVRAARLNSSPHSDSLGRPMKVGREEMIGVWLAAEKYSKLDFGEVERQSFSQAEYLRRELSKISGLRLAYSPHDRTRKVHRLEVVSFQIAGAEVGP